MCRHLAYLGTPIALGTLLFDAPHSLSEQAARPWHQAPGRVNKDGWGVGWFAGGEPEPHTYRTVTAMWDDTAFADRATTSGAFVAAARLASPGATLHPSGNAPFTADGRLFSLNGYVAGFREGVEEELRAGISERRQKGIVGDADTEVVFAMVLDRLDHGEEPARALATTVTSIAATTDSKLNLVLADAHTFCATRFGNSLFGRAATIASEPLDDPEAWDEIPEHSLVCASRARGGEIEVVPL